MNTNVSNILKAVDLINSSSNTVILTGAGMSTDSGLKDFRSNNGLWNGHDPQKCSHVKTLRHHPETVINFYIDIVTDILKNKPNKGHYILSKWEDHGVISGVATQNIDMYHQIAGSKNVIELHGNRNFRTWLGNQEINAEEFLEMQRTHEFWLIENEDYDDIYRPNVVLFGEELGSSYYKAEKMFSNADLCIVLGSSLSVSPVNQLPLMTTRNNGKLIIVSSSKTELDYEADVKLEMNISDFLDSVDRALFN